MEGSIIDIDKDKVIKHGERVRLEEAVNMMFIKENTNIPIPKILDFYKKDNENYIIMEYIEGNTLDEMLKNNKLTNQELDFICKELRNYLKQLKNIKGSYIGSMNNKSVYDPLFENMGPFYNEKEFNNFIINYMKEILKNYYPTYISKMLINNHSINFTHGDINPKNIIIKNKRIVGIIDWEFSGYYPEYWEYVRAMINTPWSSIWFSKIDTFLEPYYYENSVFNMILKAFF